MDRRTLIGTDKYSMVADAEFVGTVAARDPAQTPPATATTPTSQTTAVPKTTAVPGENPKSGMPFPGGHHKRGMKGGFGEFGVFGHGGFAPTADMANRQITQATEFLTMA